MKTTVEYLKSHMFQAAGIKAPPMVSVHHGDLFWSEGGTDQEVDEGFSCGNKLFLHLLEKS